MKENVFKAVFAAVTASLTVYFKAMAIPIIILFVVIIADYSTGMVKAWITKELNSRLGVIGIVKKLCYLIVVCVGMSIDWVITAVLTQVGVDYTAAFSFGLIVAVWLIINELISILENLSIIGVPFPSFLTKIVSKLKITVESKADNDTAAQNNKEVL